MRLFKPVERVARTFGLVEEAPFLVIASESAFVIAIWRVKSVFLHIDEVGVLDNNMFGDLGGQVNEIEVVAKLL